ncbi:hypothetical protein EYF80_037210 [Liparis tanakae]|uniref:Uncharacterized protein n=1 Tax=Liparis tanakae TaxID=230148 RepID=A0A4Z2GGG5_9TELE|nr:hypothetical protein EYF80_037210 [Liparis tanakae]
MKPSSWRGRPSAFRKSEEERGDRSKSGMSPRLENGSPPSSDSVAVAVDDVDAGDEGAASSSDWSAGGEGGGTREGSASGLEGLAPVTGLQTPELSSGQRKTSIGPCVLFSDTW